MGNPSELLVIRNNAYQKYWLALSLRFTRTCSFNKFTSLNYYIIRAVPPRPSGIYPFRVVVPVRGAFLKLISYTTKHS